MATTITRLFDDHAQATQAVNDLEINGIPHNRISLVANNEGDRYSSAAPAPTGTSDALDAPTSTETTAGTGATIGTVLGGGAGVLAGLGMLAIPGVGPIVAAGWLVALLTGAGVGAAGGGLLGGLLGAGVNEAEAHVYTEGVRRGGTLVSVQAEEAEAMRVEQVLAKYAPVDVTTRGEEYRSAGWTRFDESAPAYTAGGSSALGTSTTNPRNTLP